MKDPNVKVVVQPAFEGSAAPVLLSTVDGLITMDDLVFVLISTTFSKLY